MIAADHARREPAWRYRLLQVVQAAITYRTIKRVLVWGSFVTAKAEPGDLDYSVVVSVEHNRAQIATPHRRFLVASAARAYSGIDRGYLNIFDYPFDRFVELMDFLCRTRSGVCRGLVEINLRGEVTGDA